MQIMVWKPLRIIVFRTPIRLFVCVVRVAKESFYKYQIEQINTHT